MKTPSIRALATSAVIAASLLVAGGAGAGTITTTSVSMPNGSDIVNIVDKVGTIDGNGNSILAGTIKLQTSIGSLNTYCVDLFDYIGLGNNSYTFNQNVMTTGSQYASASGATTNWSQTQINLLNALLYNGSLQASTTVNSAALQIAIWEVEYGTAAANGTYNLTANNQNFYFTTNSSDSNSGAAISLAQTYLNNVTGYLDGGTRFVSAIWNLNASSVVEYLTSTPVGTQNLVYLASAPEPSTVAVFGLGLVGVWRARRKQRR